MATNKAIKEGQTQSTLLRTDRKWILSKTAKLKPHGVISYSRYEGSTTNSQTNKASLANLDKLKEADYNGFMSPNTRRHVRTLLDNFLLSIKLSTNMTYPFVKGQEKPMDVVYPTFVTLTLPGKQMHSDEDIRRYIFTPFMQNIIRNWKVENYVWVSETQANGNLHFHVLIDRAIPALRLRQIWNHHLDAEPFCYVQAYRRCQQRIYGKRIAYGQQTWAEFLAVKRAEAKAKGLVLSLKEVRAMEIEFKYKFVFREEMWLEKLEKEQFKAKEKGKRLNAKDISELKAKEKDRQKKAYSQSVVEDWQNPNSTDIHAIQNITKLTAYITKYFTKKPAIEKPKLATNEKLVEEAGNYYIETTTEQHDTTFGTVITSTIKEKQLWKPVFKNRKLHGRIWGASARLKNPDTAVKYYVVELGKLQSEENTYAMKNVRVQRMRLDTVHGVIFKDKEMSHEWQETKIITRPTDTNWDAINYLKSLRTVVPLEEIKRATASAGELFASRQDNEIIPLEEPQEIYLRQHSPPIWALYRQHYNDLYSRLYPIAA
jgi:hypothetical protein